MQDKLLINEIELKAAVYDYVMSHILDKSFEDIAAVAGDILKIVIETGKPVTQENE